MRYARLEALLTQRYSDCSVSDMKSIAMLSLLVVGSTGLNADTPDRPSYLRLQVLLDRAHFSPGEIDGVAGDNTELESDAHHP